MDKDKTPDAARAADTPVRPATPHGPGPRERMSSIQQIESPDDATHPRRPGSARPRVRTGVQVRAPWPPRRDPEATAVIRPGDPEATAVIRPGDPEATAVIRPGDPEATAVIRPGDPEATAVIRPGDPEATAVIRPGDPEATAVIRPGDPEATAVIATPARDADAVPAASRAPVVPGRPGTGLPSRVAAPQRADGRDAELPGAGASRADAGPSHGQERRRIPRWERRRVPRGGPWDLGHAPFVLLVSSLGVLMVAWAYAGGRDSAAGAPVAYWIGQIVVFTPVVLRLLSRRMAGVAESFLLVMGLAINQYLLKWMYSPDQFRFPDELQHWLATTIVLETGKLFQPNPALPPAVHFPGLAEMGAAIASMTGLPVSVAGIMVAGVAHLVFVGVLFALVLRTSNSPAVAGVTCAIYATALHYLFFSSMFLYQTAALPFFMLAIWANRRWREGNGRVFAAITVLSIGLTTVCHHVTAFALVATLLLVSVAEVATHRPRRWSALIMPTVALAVVSAWILLVARDVIGYLEAPAEQVVETVRMLLTNEVSAGSVSAPVSVGQLVLQGSGLIGLFVLYLAVARDMVTRRDSDDWRWAALAGGAIFFAGNGVRFLGQNGPEIAGRLSTFTYVPISIIAAIALVRAVQILPARDAEGRRWWVQPALYVAPPTGRNLVLRVLAGSALVTILMIGARAGGWPPLGSLLPGPYLAGGFERSVDAYGVDAANWERTTLGPGHRVGGDVTSVSLASTYGRQDPVREVGSLYYADQWTLDDEQKVADLGLDYLVVDRRLSTQLPVSEAYFENDPRAGRITQPLTAAQIGKFDALSGVDRLYDNGTVRIYRMGNA
ncbi:hypothetical protein [Mangrovihabitans endophyticus]|nr:hypothetical protein [Mangrovihabitans endophyticus]